MNAIINWVLSKTLGKISGLKTVLGLVVWVIGEVLKGPAILISHIPAGVVGILDSIVKFLGLAGITPEAVVTGGAALTVVGVAHKVVKMDEAMAAVPSAPGGNPLQN